MRDNVYDMLIVGGGPGGYTAALYAARAGLRVAVLEKMSAGGQMAETPQIDNYPGIPQGIDGFSLGQQMQSQAEQFGAETFLTEVTELRLHASIKVAETTQGTFQGKTIVLATGAEPRHLGVPGEEERIGRGVHYCAACDGMFYRGKTVAVVGGGNTAAADALLLSRVAKKVILIHRRDTLRASRVYHKTLQEAENVEFYWNSAVTQITSGQLTVENLTTGEKTDLFCDGVFVAIGRQPATSLVEPSLLDEQGYIRADESTATQIPGVFAVGDVRTKAVRQIVTAVADGAAAAYAAEEHLAEQ